MYKKRIILAIIIIVMLTTFVVPGLIKRVSFEQTTKVYTPAIDLTRLAKFFNSFDLPEALEQYKKAGATTAVITEMRGLYSEEHLTLAKNANMHIALVPDVSVTRDADIERICSEYPVKYIKFQRSIWRDIVETDSKAKPLCDVIKKYGLTVVISESGLQLSNIEVKNFEKYLEASNGNIARNFNSYNNTNIDVMDYPAIYYQIYNSAYDRNTRFITIKQLEDEGFSASENAQRTQDNLKLFCKKMENHGFKKEGTVDYRNYKSVSRSVSGAIAVISVLMVALMFDMLLKDKIHYLFEISLAVASFAFAVSFILPSFLITLYPTLFATLAPCFGITICAKFINAAKQKLSFIPLLLSSVIIAISLFMVNGAIMSSLLTGPEYLLNTYTFRGVKLTLIAPMVFTAILLISTVYQKISFKKIKTIKLKDIKQLIVRFIKSIRWYHVALSAAVIIVVAVYLVRSGNVSSISFTETYIRNWLTEYFTARPRTKEILLAWPFFALYIYYAKKDSAKILQWIFAVGASMLFASTINTFCHVFTLTETMFLRIATGILFGGIITVIALIVNHLGYKLFSKLFTKN